MRRISLLVLTMLSLLPLACLRYKKFGGFSKNQSAASSAQAKNWIFPNITQATSDHFNLAAYIKDSKEMSALQKFVKDGATGLGFGDRSKLRVETNLTSDLVNEKGSESVGATAQYSVDMYIMNKNIAGDGALVDFKSYGQPGDPNKINAHMRILGDDKVSTDASAIDQTFMRDLPFQIPIVPIPPAEIIVTATVGGEFGLNTQLGVNQKQKLQLLFVPDINLYLKLSGGVKLLAVVEAKAEGQIKMLSMKPSLSVNSGLYDTFTYGGMSEDSGGINAIDGKIDLVANIGFTGIEAVAFKAALEAIGLQSLGDGKEWRWNVFDPEPVVGNNITPYQSSILSFPKVPANAAECVPLINSEDAEIKSHINDLKAFTAKLSNEAKSIAVSSTDQLSQLEQKVVAICK